jgi:short-subunit dehydrogenase
MPMNALITGGSRGLGKAVALELADAGFDLLLVAKTPRNLDAASREIKSRSKSRVECFACDLADAGVFSELAEFAKKNDIMPNVLVLSAGVLIEKNLAAATPSDFQKAFSVDFMSAYHCVQSFIPHLRETPNSRVVFISSTAAHEPFPENPLCGIAKWALRGYAVNLRKELMNDGISVTHISPGDALTDQWAGVTFPEGRLLDPRDIGKIVRTVVSLSPQAVVEEVIVRPMLGDVEEY